MHPAHTRGAGPFAKRRHQLLPQLLTAEAFPKIYMQMRRIIVKRRAGPMPTFQPQPEIDAQKTHGLRMPQRTSQ